MGGAERIVAAGNGDRFALRPLDCPTSGEKPRGLVRPQGNRAANWTGTASTMFVTRRR